MTMNKLLTETPFMALVLFLCLIVVSYSQDKSPALIKQEKLLAEVPFDRVVLYTLIALEQNYKVKERLFPKVHKDDYLTLILNTAKRLAVQDSGKVALPGPNKSVKADSTKKVKEKNNL